jgi:hypothetical protein
MTVGAEASRKFGDSWVHLNWKMQGYSVHGMIQVAQRVSEKVSAGGFAGRRGE